VFIHCNATMDLRACYFTMHICNANTDSPNFELNFGLSFIDFS